MQLTGHRIEDLTEADLQRLIDARVVERRDIDYKRETYGGKDADHAEFLADASSFANTLGGDLVIGMEERAGLPISFHPFRGDADAEILRLETLARTGLQPRISDLAGRAIPLAGGGCVIVLRIPRSFSAPHRIGRRGKGEHRFWGRTSNGKYELDVDELRRLFVRAPELADRIRQFRAGRVAQVVRGDGPVKLLDGPVLLIHIVPFSSFDLEPQLSIDRVWDDYERFPPPGSAAPQNRVTNFEGVLMTSNADETALRQRAYVQVFRNGVVEAVASSLARSFADCL